MLGIGDVHPIQVGPGPLPRVLPGGKRLEDMTPLEREVWTNGFYFRGGIKDAFSSKGHEIIVGGPYETGKSFGLELKFYLMNAKYPNCRSLMIRKRYKDLVGSGIEMLRDNIIVNPWQPHPLGHSKCPVEVYGGTDEPKSLKFKNGSIIYFRGFDDPTKGAICPIRFCLCRAGGGIGTPRLGAATWTVYGSSEQRTLSTSDG